MYESTVTIAGVDTHCWLFLSSSVPACYKSMQVFSLLDANPHIVLDETLEVVVEHTEEPPADAEYRILGNVRAFIERLDDELFKILQVRASPVFVLTPW
jgi:Eukaryotic translation initiation factor 3 subunit 8 N-terminus